MSPTALTAAHERLQALVGSEGPPVAGTVLRRDIERFARASGEESEVYFDEAAAHAAGHPAVPSPPMLLPAVIEWGPGPALGELREDGTGVGREAWLPLEGLRLMGGGQDLEFHAQVYAGQDFAARPCLASVDLKEGGSGTLVILVIATEFRDPEGRRLVTCRETLIGR